MPNDNTPSVASTALLDPSGIKLSSDDWWSFDTAKHGFFFEKCCRCGLVHKTHIRIEGTRIHFRNERLEGDPPPEMVDQSSVIVSNPAITGDSEAGVRCNDVVGQSELKGESDD